MTKNIVEDPNIYDYDSFVDDYREKRNSVIQEQKKVKKESILLGSIKDTLAKRNREFSVNQEKLEEKKLIRENKLNQNAEKFVTANFKKVVSENKTFEE